jgi:Ca2+-binding RTX toxin-like protein
MVPRPVPTPPKATLSTLTVYQDYTLPAAKNVLVVSVAGGAQGSGAKGTGSSASTNYLISRSQNFANTRDVNGSYLGLSAVGNTLVAGSSAATTLQGGDGNDSLYAAGSVKPVTMYGGSGSTTMVAGSGKATLVGGNLSNSLVAGSGNQLLQGGNNSSTTTYLDSTGKKTMTVTTGNTLLGGSGKDTLVGGTGYNTLVSGSVASVDTVLAANAKKGSTQITVKTVKDLQLGQTINGIGLATGCVITKISGNKITLSKKTLRSMVRDTPLRAIPYSVSNTLVGAGISSSLVASAQGNDSLAGGSSSSSTLIGGTGRDTLTAGTTSGASSWLQSGASTVVGATGNTLIGSAQSNSSVTMVAASASDSLAAGPGANTFVVNAVNKEAFAAAHFSLGTFSTLPSSRVTGPEVIALSSIPGGSSLTAGSFAFSDTLLSGLQSAVSTYKTYRPGSQVPVALVNNLGKAEFISLGTVSGALGLTSITTGSIQGSTVVGGQTLYGDTIDASSDTLGFTLNATGSRMPISLLGSSASDLVYLSQAGKFALKDAVQSGGGNDTMIAQNTLFGSVDGGANSSLSTEQDSLSTGDMLTVNFGSASLNDRNFANLQNIENLSLLSGTNLVGSLQGSGIQRVIGGTGSDTLMGNAVALLASATNISANPNTLSLQLPAGTPANGTLGFAIGQYVTGNGIGAGTRISDLTTSQNSDGSGTMTLLLDTPLTVNVQKGRPISAWFNGITLDGSRNAGLGTTNQNATLSAANYAKSLAYSFNNPVGNPGEEITNATAFLQALQSDPNAFIHLSGDSLSALGSGVFLSGPNDPTSTFDLTTPYTFTDLLYKQTHKINSGLPLGGNSTIVSAKLRYVSDSTLNASADPLNTLVGNSGHTVYLLNNIPGTSTDLPNILLHDANGTGYLATANAGTSGEIRFNGDNLTLDVGVNYSRVTPGAVNQISINNGNNLVHILPSSGINQNFSLISGNGSDTLYTDPDYSSNVFIDAHRGSGLQSLASGQGDDTILAGSGNATISGGDGNNSLIGGAGTNSITSGVGNSTLDGGYGASTLQAIAGQNFMVIRNRKARILLNSDPSLNPQNTPLELTVNSYVNFDPIQSTELDQFAPAYPDGSPSITKSTSFASSDLASFYAIKNFNLFGDFTTGTGAVYGVGNALDNAMVQGRDPGILNPNENVINNASGALMLGMGGNNILTSWGKNASLYGFSNESYANPDLYAAAPTDTRTRDFITNVMGTPGNNLLVANGSGSFLDGGPGYNAGNGSPASNTLVGNASNDTFVIRHRSDSVVAAAGANTVYSTVDLNSLPENITEAVLVVADQNQYLRNFSGNAPVLPSNSGQDAPATYLSYGSAHANSSVTHSVTDGQLTFSVPNSSQMQVQYGTYALNHFQSDSVPTPDTRTRDQYFPLTVSDPLPDGNNPGMVAYQLDWNADLMRSTGVVAGYTVLYRVQDDGTGQPGAWKTYVDGTSQDLQGTTDNPVLMVDNLDSGFTYDFQVTAVQLEHPFTFDSLGNEVATPATLRGNSGNDVIWTFTGTQDSLGHGQNLGTSTWYRNVNPVLGNNPADPLPAGTIPLSGPYAVSHYDSPLFPVYLDGADGNNLLLSNQIGNGDGTSITIEAGTASSPQTLTYSGFNTMEGGNGSDTFLVANGTQNNFDLCIKYGNETPVDYTNTAPGVPSSLSGAGVSLNGGQHNMIASALSTPQGYLTSNYSPGSTTLEIRSFYSSAAFTAGQMIELTVKKTDSPITGLNSYTTYSSLILNYDSLSGVATLSTPLSYNDIISAGSSLVAASGIQLSDTTVSQGKYIDQLLLLNGSQFGEGNRLDNFIYDVNFGGNTLVGNTGRDSILGQGLGGNDYLIGGTAALGDSVQGAMLGLYGALPSIVGGVAGYYTKDGSGNYTLPVTSSTPTLQGGSYVFGAYRDTDPMPATVQSGPGAADPSQYWFVSGSGNYDPLRNSDTLIANVASTLDGGAGSDSMLGSTGNDWFVVSDGFSSSDHINATGTIVAGAGDVVVGTGGNDTICFTGSDLWWSGNSYYNAGLSYTLSGKGDDQGGQSISNLVLQGGAVNAYGAYGNNASTGNQHKGNLGSAELGSNLLVGNEFNNLLDGGGVGGDAGTGYGADTLIGGGGNDTFIAKDYYRASNSDVIATFTTSQVTVGGGTYNTYSLTKPATDADYLTLPDFTITTGTNSDLLSLKTPASGFSYAIGGAPSSFTQGNITPLSNPQSTPTNHFGIYYVDLSGRTQPNLVADITTDTAMSLASSTPVVAGSVQINGSSLAGGGSYFSQVNGDLLTGQNFLGYGAMYSLASTPFASSVTLS